MLSINGKKFMNLPEAVQWLLNNNALPFQCKANYVADTIIAKTDIINPSPAEIKVGSLVLFADGKVGTVSGITDNGFMVGTDATDLSDGVPHIVDISLDASNHLIFTMSEGSPIDAGLVKMVSSFTIDASQHLIVNYNDGTSTDLGAIFQGNINISGSLTADTVEQTQANWKSTSFAFDSPGADIELTNVYNSLEVVNGTMNIIINIMVKNNGASDFSFGGVDKGTTIPHEYASKIYDILGKTVSEVATIDYAFVAGEPAISQKNDNTYHDIENNAKLFICNRQTEDYMNIFMQTYSTVVLHPNDYIIMSGRIALTLL